jgi:hypothetical protein
MHFKRNNSSQLLYPGQLYRLLGASSIGVTFLFYIGVISLFYIGVTSLFYIGVISLTPK